MGLDIYVRWGAIGDDGDDVDFPEDIRQDQCTGFENAPECGYLRHNWTSVRFCHEFSIKYEVVDPIRGMYPEWNGSNGESIDVTADALQHLFRLRSRVQEWLRNKPYEKRNAFIEAAATSATKDEVMEEFNYFSQCLRNLVSFINFIELHKDKPNLRIVFG